MYDAGYKRLVTLLLMLAYAFNSAHRGLIAVIAQPMKVDLKLSDAQLGLLAGTAFASLYALSGVPVARLAERCNRVSIISLALAVWSALTALCGAAGSFTQLLVLRVGVGIGEAGCSAPAHSLISDYYDRTRRTSALSVYSCGLSLGYLFVSVVGGYVVLHQGWRAACLAVGLPGVAVAVLIKRIVAEPARGHAEGAAPAAIAPFSLRAEGLELAAVARTLFCRWPLANIILGLTVSSFAAYGAYVFIPAYFNRDFGLDFATIGVVLGLAGSIPVALGTFGGGWLADLLGARRARWYALVPAAGLALSTPLYVLALLERDWRSAALLLAVAGFFQYVSLGPTFGIVQNVVATGQRATATALLYLCLILLALAGGPPFTGWLIDHLAAAHFAQSHAAAITGDVAAAGIGAPAQASAFRAACPGGVGAAGCAVALAAASREGIVATLCLQAWAALHYLLGAIGLERQMQGAADRAMLR
jgi:predicted MFS family arabinose efflux permease